MTWRTIKQAQWKVSWPSFHTGWSGEKLSPRKWNWWKDPTEMRSKQQVRMGMLLARRAECLNPWRRTGLDMLVEPKEASVVWLDCRWRRRERGRVHPESQREHGPISTLISDFYPHELWDNAFLGFFSQLVCTTCCNSPREPKYSTFWSVCSVFQFQ